MAKQFITERDVEDMFKRGVMSIAVTDDVVLTELAYEKANRLGIQLVRGTAVTPPSAPVRPYISQAAPAAAASPAPAVPAAVPQDDLQKRIRDAVTAKLGSQVDAQLLDVIIQRVLKSTGVK